MKPIRKIKIATATKSPLAAPKTEIIRHEKNKNKLKIENFFSKSENKNNYFSATISAFNAETSS